MKSALQGVTTFSQIRPNPGMQPHLSLQLIDVDAVTCRHLLGPLLRSVLRIYSELPIATSAFVLLSAVRSLFSRNAVARSSHSNPRCRWWDREHSTNTKRKINCTERTTRTLFRSRDSYWKELAEECVDHRVGVTLILTPNRYGDTATLGGYFEFRSTTF